MEIVLVEWVILKWLPLSRRFSDGVDASQLIESGDLPFRESNEKGVAISK